MRTPFALAGCGFILAVFSVLPPASLDAQGAASRTAAGGDIAAGGRLFRTNCAPCHGIGAIGARGPNLAAGRYRYATTDSAFLDVITEGIPGTAMGGWAGGRVLAERRSIIAYVRSLSRGAVPEKPPGDSARGAALFAGRGGCLQCHRVNGAGGDRGPELSAIGWTRTLATLKTAVLDPNASVDGEFYRMRVTTREGRVVEGRRLADETFDVRLVTDSGALRAFRRSDLKDARIVRESIMPGVKGVMNDAEVNDLISYLTSLRGIR